MRLTNVAQMALPQGTLHSYAVRTSGVRGRAVPLSFDQRRHVGEGDRPGSWMAIAFRAPLGTDPDALSAAWHAVISRHGTLGTVFARDDAGGLTLHETEIVDGEWRQHPVPSGASTREALRAVLDRACAPFAEPSHRLCVVLPEPSEREADEARGTDAADERPVVVLGADHAHVDMWSLLVLARDVVAMLEDGDRVDERAASFAEHSRLLEAMPAAPEDVRSRWAEILRAGDGLMPRFPLPLGDLSVPRREIVEVRDVLDAAGTALLEEHARAHGVRMTACALAVIAGVTRRLADAPLRAVFPVHSRHEPRWHDSVGWFITNSVIEIDDPTPHAGAAAVKEALALGSHPLAPLLAPYGGMPQAPGMFAISWLDTRRLPAVRPGMSIQYVSAVIDTDGVMIWFIVNDEGLHLRCRYPDTPEARASVGTWLDGVEQGLRGLLST
jgi:hypothetical protein